MTDAEYFAQLVKLAMAEKRGEDMMLEYYVRIQEQVIAERVIRRFDQAAKPDDSS